MKNIFEGGIILPFLSSLAEKISQSAGKSLSGGAFLSYDEVNKPLQRHNEGLLSERKDKKSRGKFRLFVAKQFEGSGFVSLINRFFNFMLTVQLRFFGTAFLSAAIIMLFSFGIPFVADGELNLLHLGCALLLLVLSLFCLFVRKSFCAVLLESRICAFLVFDFFGIRRDGLYEKPTIPGSQITAMLVGMAVGALTFAVSPLYVILGFVGIIGVYVIFVYPETGVMLILLAAPFMGILPHPSILMAGMNLFVGFCTMMKVIRGKRTVRFELIDLFVLIFFIITLLGGVVSVSFKDSISYAAMYCILMLGYFLVATLMRNAEWIRRCVIALLFSCTAVSVYGIYQKLTGSTMTTWTDTEMFGSDSGRIISTFENPNVLAEYLIMCIPFIVALFLIYDLWGKKAGMLAVLGAVGLALVYTMSRGAWLGCIIAMMIFLLIYSSKTLVLYLFGLMCVPFLPFVLPDSIVKRFSSIGNISDSSTAYRVHIWEGCIEMIKDHWLSGIGVGKDVFALVYPSYTLSGIESAPHAHNLFLQITIETGVVGIVFFVAMIFVLVQLCFTSYRKADLGKAINRELKLYSAAALCGVLALLAQGMTDYVWYNYRVFLMFWLLVGIAVSSARAIEN